jgi:hypothetical protein
MRRHLSRLWIALAIVPLIAGAALASGPAMFVCRGDSIARVTCCCPDSQHRAAAPNAAPTLSAACCCDTSQMNAPSAPAVLEPRAGTGLAYFTGIAPALGAGPDAAWAPSVRRWPAALLAQPPPPAVPILLGKQSFLI